MKTTTEGGIDFKEIKKMATEFKGFRYPKYIKMKQEYYDKLADEVQKQVNIIEVRDVNMQPINTLYGLKVVIDNDIEKDYEVVYEESIR